MFVTVKNIKIEYTDTGAGAPILLLHGWGACKEVWQGVVSLLKGQYRCIALDLPGCGGSGLPEAPLTVEDYAALVLEFLKTLEIENPILIGHSHGGRTILELLTKGHLRPAKVVLFGSAGIPAKKTFKKSMRQFCFKTAKKALLLPGIRRCSAGALDKLRSVFGSADYNAAPEVMRRTMVQVLHTDYTQNLPKITAPCLLIWGENDTATPLWQGQLMEKQIPDAGLCVIKGAGHYSFTEQPGQVYPILKSYLNIR